MLPFFCTPSQHFCIHFIDRFVSRRRHRRRRNRIVSDRRRIPTPIGLTPTSSDTHVSENVGIVGPAPSLSTKHFKLKEKKSAHLLFLSYSKRVVDGLVDRQVTALIHRRRPRSVTWQPINSSSVRFKRYKTGSSRFCPTCKKCFCRTATSSTYPTPIRNDW